MKINWCNLLVVAALLVCSSVAFAQPGGFGGFGGGGLGLLNDENVQKELELVPEQQEKLRAAGEKLREEMQDMFSGLRDLPQEDRQARFAELREKMQGMQEQMQEEINGILLPPQQDRLAQIQFQSQLRRGGGSTGALTGNAVVEALGITEEQLEQMRAKEEEVRGELQQKIREATEDARKELLSVLNADQRKKYEELTGEPFEFPQRQGFQRGGNRGGGPGNRGGRGGAPQRPEI